MHALGKDPSICRAAVNESARRASNRVVDQPPLHGLRLPPVAVVWFGLVAATAGLMPCVAHAALGGDLASIDREQAALQAERVVTPAVAYDLHELITPNGTRVREYLDRSGRVFAVSWSGPRLPDLGQLLGAYAER